MAQTPNAPTQAANVPAPVVNLLRFGRNCTVSLLRELINQNQIKQLIHIEMKKQNQNKKQTVSSKIEQLFKEHKPTGNARKSLTELLRTGETVTGKSGYSKGYASKSIWTAGVVRIAAKFGLTVESGNNAPKGGAGGEFIKLVTDKRKNKLHWQLVAILERKHKIEAAKIMRKSKETAHKRLVFQVEVKRDFEMVKPFIPEFCDQIAKSKEMSGIEKSQFQSSIVKALLEKSGINKAAGFWELWTLISDEFHTLNKTELINNQI